MMQTPERFGRVMRHAPAPLVWGTLPAERMWLWARRGTLARGMMAPDFTLEKQDRSGRVPLSNFRAPKAVVLVFGIYSGPPFRRAVPALNTLYERYRDRVEFFVV